MTNTTYQQEERCIISKTYPLDRLLIYPGELACFASFIVAWSNEWQITIFDAITLLYGSGVDTERLILLLAKHQLSR